MKFDGDDQLIGLIFFHVLKGFQINPASTSETLKYLPMRLDQKRNPIITPVYKITNAVTIHRNSKTRFFQMKKRVIEALGRIQTSP